MEKTLKIALFGFGRMGKIHFKTLLANQYRLKLTYIVDEYPEKVKSEIETSFNLFGTKFCKNDETETVLSDKNLDAIVICVPTERHRDLVQLAIKYKKHVMCEKPIALTIEETQACYDAADREGVILFCALQRLFDPDYVRIHDQVRDGTLGKIQMAMTYVRDHPEPPEETIAGLGNLFSDMSPHGIAVLNWIIGEKPESVTAYAHGIM